MIWFVLENNAKMKESVHLRVTNFSGDLPGASSSGRVSIIFSDVYTRLQ